MSWPCWRDSPVATEITFVKACQAAFLSHSVRVSEQAYEPVWDTKATCILRMPGVLKRQPDRIVDYLTSHWKATGNRLTSGLLFDKLRLKVFTYDVNTIIGFPGGLLPSKPLN